MKKKVLYGFAMALIASVSMGTLQSCKDDLSDFKHQYTYDQAGLLKKISDLEAAVAKCRENCKAEMDILEAKIKDNADKIENLDLELKNLARKLDDYVTLTDLAQRLQTLEDNCKTYTDQQVANALAPIVADLTKVQGDLSDLTGVVNGLKDDYEALKPRVDANEAAIIAAQATLENHTTVLRELDGKLNILEAQVLGHTEEIEGLRLQIEELNGYIEEAFLAIEQTQQYMTQMMQALLDTIEDAFNQITNRVDNLITGIVIQGTDSPVFGNFSLPIGVQSNMLFNWYGYNDNRDFKFPSASSMDNYYDAAPVLTEADLAALAPAYQDVKKGYLGDVNLGKLYMTINPAGHLFNEDGFVLESSAENAFPATLKVKKSNDELTFGYTRSTVEGNGFYEADVIVETANIDAAKMEIQDGLKSTVEDALKDPSKRTAIGLLKGVYSQFNNTLPAYAVRYNWNNDGTDYSVLSNYAVAATTAKPLSYSFLYGKGSDKKIRTFGHLDNFIKRLIDKNLNTIKIEGKDMEVLGHKIGFAKGEVSIVKTSAYELTATVTGVTVDGTEIPAVTAQFSDPAEASVYINKALAKALAKAIGQDGDDETIAKFEASVSITLLQMQKQINEVLEGVNGQIHDAFDNIGDQAESYAKRLNRLVDLYNKVAGKINNFLANPNHYLQVAMFYNQADSEMGILSNTIASPTVFNSGNGSVGLYASSYTAELVCPAYLKYVAVTNVYDANTKAVAANAAAERSAVNSAAKNFNTVMSGNTIRYSIPASALKSGLIYEIAYQGVDYSGRTSTQKFYIQVK